jgi:hypothetical protein
VNSRKINFFALDGRWVLIRVLEKPNQKAFSDVGAGMETSGQKQGTLETEATSFLLAVAGSFFLLETIVHYDDFFVSFKSTSDLIPIILVVGSLAVTIFYLVLGYSCWKNPTNGGLFVFAIVFSGLMSLAYFIIAIVESTSAQVYFSPYFNYAQFLVGYGSVTIFVELLILFFSWRVYRAQSHGTISY